MRGSILKVTRRLREAPCNGWEHWYYQDKQSGERMPINVLRQALRGDNPSYAS